MKLLPLLLFLMPSAKAEPGDYIYTIANSEVTITGWFPIPGDLSIPDTIEGLPVVTIAKRAFQGKRDVTSITIPNSVITIGEEAFTFCTGATSITIGSNVVSIGAEAFKNCNVLASVTIPDSVTIMGDGVFRWCIGLERVVIGNSVTSIPDFAFFECADLTSVVIGESVTSIGEQAFVSCTQLTNFTIPDSITSIGFGAFGSCTGLRNVTIGESVTSIGSAAFNSCHRLKSVIIPNSVTSIENLAFNSCARLTNVTIGNGVTTIGEWAFRNCNSLSSAAFLGNAPAAFFTEVFLNTDPEFTIFYLNGSTGFTSPIWQGYPATLVDGAAMLDVSYDTPTITSGPLSFGLSELPAIPQPTFFVGGGTSLGEGVISYGLDDVVSASLVFGDGVFTTLTAFSMELAANGNVDSLTYQFSPIDTATAEGPVILNFPLTITGTDIASGEAFSYTYANSAQTITSVFVPVQLALSVLGLAGDTLSLTIEGIPSGRTFHLRQSTDLTAFEPLASPVDITDTTQQPLEITLDPTTDSLFISVYEGASPGP